MITMGWGRCVQFLNIVSVTSCNNLQNLRDRPVLNGIRTELLSKASAIYYTPRAECYKDFTDYKNFEITSLDS